MLEITEAGQDEYKATRDCVPVVGAKMLGVEALPDDKGRMAFCFSRTGLPAGSVCPAFKLVTLYSWEITIEEIYKLHTPVPTPDQAEAYQRFVHEVAGDHLSSVRTALEGDLEAAVGPQGGFLAYHAPPFVERFNIYKADEEPKWGFHVLAVACAGRWAV